MMAILKSKQVHNEDLLIVAPLQELSNDTKADRRMSIARATWLASIYVN